MILKEICVVDIVYNVFRLCSVYQNQIQRRLKEPLKNIRFNFTTQTQPVNCVKITKILWLFTLICGCRLILFKLDFCWLQKHTSNSFFPPVRFIMLLSCSILSYLFAFNSNWKYTVHKHLWMLCQSTMWYFFQLR